MSGCPETEVKEGSTTYAFAEVKCEPTRLQKITTPVGLQRKFRRSQEPPVDGRCQGKFKLLVDRKYQCFAVAPTIDGCYLRGDGSELRSHHLCSNIRRLWVLELVASSQQRSSFVFLVSVSSFSNSALRFPAVQS